MLTGSTNYIYKNYFDQTCFQHDMIYGKYKYLNKRTASDKFLNTKILKLQVIQNMMHIKEEYLQWFTNFLIKYLKVVVY